MKRFTLLIFFYLLAANLAFGHQDFWITKDFGNVKVRIRTGYLYEEINKCWIIGEQVSKLCKQLNYTEPIFIDFNHHYVGDCDPDYFLSFDDGSIAYTFKSEKPKPFLKRNALVIREVSRQFTPSITLRLVEYAIANADKIKSTQRTIEYEQNYCQWRIKTIDTIHVKKIAAGSISDRVKKILLTKVYRSENDKVKSNISYYFLDNKYHIFFNGSSVKDSVLLVVDNIYQLKSISPDKSLVFDSDSSFYFVQFVNEPHVSKRNVIERIFENYIPFDFIIDGANNVLFSFWYYDNTKGNNPKKREVLYKSDTDELVQDLE